MNKYKEEIAILVATIPIYEEGGLCVVKDTEEVVFIDCEKAEDGVAEVNIDNLIEALKEMKYK